MTFYKTLAQKTVDGVIVTAYAKQEKFSNVWNYEIVVSDGSGFVNACDVYQTARTTWKRKFNSLPE